MTGEELEMKDRIRDKYRTRIGYLTMFLHTTKSPEKRREVLEELDRLRAEMERESK